MSRLSHGNNLFIKEPENKPVKSVVHLYKFISVPEVGDESYKVISADYQGGIIYIRMKGKSLIFAKPLIYKHMYMMGFIVY